VSVSINDFSAIFDGTGQGHVLRLPAAGPFLPLFSGMTNPIGRLGESGGVMSSRSERVEHLLNSLPLYEVVAR
jgi:hypothetical protein